MVKKIRNQKTIDWDLIKFQAFTSGFKELYNFMQSANKDGHNGLVGELTFPQYSNTKQISKVIRQQANTFGLKCGIATYEFGNIGNDTNRIARRISLGAYY